MLGTGTAPASHPQLSSPLPATPVAMSPSAVHSPTSPATDVTESSPEEKTTKKDKKEGKEKKEKKHKKEKKNKKASGSEEFVISAPKNVRVEATERPLALATSASAPALQSDGATANAADGTPNKSVGMPVRTPRSKLAQQLKASGTRKRLTTKPPAEMEKRRANIAKELLYTENTYVKNMQYLLKVRWFPSVVTTDAQ